MTKWILIKMIIRIKHLVLPPLHLRRPSWTPMVLVPTITSSIIYEKWLFWRRRWWWWWYESDWHARLYAYSIRNNKWRISIKKYFLTQERSGKHPYMSHISVARITWLLRLNNVYYSRDGLYLFSPREEVRSECSIRCRVWQSYMYI